jgi:hypothetical protein
VPAGAFAGAIYTDLVGVVGGIALALLIRRQGFTRQEART